MTTDDQFELFWRSYPRRVAKGNARMAFAKAIKKTTLEAMQKAITEYVARKPERIDFKHPATWLNGECWSDEWPVINQQQIQNTTGRRTIRDAAAEFDARFGNSDASFRFPQLSRH